jgi:serine/threonine-protein kinase
MSDDPIHRLSAALESRYRIDRELGEGGMATVYLAEDLKHERKVAVKVLRPELAAVLGAERFVQEIKTTAGLQHPHILPLHDSGEIEGFLYYVMPFIDGETLRDKLNRETQLGIDEAVKITTEVADALDYAHRHDVIHRDIKPENILLHDGRPMVTDFGIALAVSAAAGGRMTETGMSLGTPHYMSPEQATAEKDITARSDVYSLGSVLYEMLTGEPPHSGGSAAAVAKSLEKVAADRFESAARFAAALNDPGFSVALPTTVGVEVRPGAGRRNWQAIAWPVLAFFAGAVVWGWLGPETAPSVARYGLALPEGQELADVVMPSFALAPDGSWIVYDGPAESGTQLWVKRRDGYEATPLAGTGHGGGSAPAVSPDGEWIVFTDGGALRKVPRGGGSAITVADSVNQNTYGIAWLDDRTIVYRDQANRLRRVTDMGGDADVVWTAPDTGDWRPRLPTPLPGARGVLFNQCTTSACLEQTMWVLDLQSGEARVLVREASQAWYADFGHVIYVRPDGGVFAAPFDLGSLTVTGPAVPVLEGVKVDAARNPDFALSLSGSLLMIAGPGGGPGAVPSEAVWVSREGIVSVIDPDWTFGTGGNGGMSLSPDGTRLAVHVQGPGGGDIWIKDLDRGPRSRLTVDPAADFRPRWTPDGQSLSFISGRGPTLDVYVRPADQTRPAELLVDLDDPVFEAVWSGDGSWLVLRGGGAGERDVWAMQVGLDSVPRPLLTSGFDESAVALSPDGRWLAYQSNETGQDEIYVRPFPDVTLGKTPVSVGGGTMPLWAHSGRELFYVDGGGRMVSAQIVASTMAQVSERHVLFDATPFILDANNTNFDIAPDDERFIMQRVIGSDAGGVGSLILVENWFEEVKQRVGR